MDEFLDMQHKKKPDARVKDLLLDRYLADAAICAMSERVKRLRSTKPKIQRVIVDRKGLEFEQSCYQSFDSALDSKKFTLRANRTRTAPGLFSKVKRPAAVHKEPPKSNTAIFSSSQ